MFSSLVMESSARLVLVFSGSGAVMLVVLLGVGKG